MTWHTDCYACTCTISANHQFQEFARPVPPPVACAIGRSLVAPPCGAPANIIDHKLQMYGPSRAGQARGGCSIHAPAAWQDPESLLTRVGSSRLSRFSLAMTLPRSTCRGLRGSGPFPFGNQPRRQAIADLPELIHSKNSAPFAHDHEAKGVGSDQEAIGVYQNVDDC